MNIYRCKFKGFVWGVDKSDMRASVMLLDDHKGFGGNVGEMCTTSKVKSIDFERCIIITQNSIYLIKGYIS